MLLSAVKTYMRLILAPKGNVVGIEATDSCGCVKWLQRAATFSACLMPTTCGFPNCKFRSRYRGQEDNRHFYRIPKRPQVLRQRWLLAIGRTEDTVVSQVRMPRCIASCIYVTPRLNKEHAEMHIHACNFACFIFILA
ncbi:unnamed protein product [Acanthocheilonema viteae]|uniref:THAP-type domain-containing protein n=1 Tax=Acanthocheilonema viteae TaxID=6277 RepID=A0A498SEV4_ACAVI|nr:unnamed protein product [Acanthocheilonema viteae]